MRENPSRVKEDGVLAFTSALWQYMTPTDPAPSAHDVVTGRWEPNASDLQNGIGRSFGLTTQILYGEDECNSNRSVVRFEIY